MKESVGQKPRTEGSVEKTANYEGDHTLLLLERLNNPELKVKLVESLTQEYLFRYYRSAPDKVESKKEKVRKKVEQVLDERIITVFNSTNLNLDEKANPAYGDLGEPGWICPYVEARKVGIDREGPLTTKQLNMAEAHEKGHGVRRFSKNSPVGKWIISALDFSNVFVSNEDLVDIREFVNTRSKPMTDEDLVRFFVRGLRESPGEIVERMSQLKNYFGMKGNEKFTKEHLDYARKNYIKDIGWPLQIKLFFDTITPKSESTFLEVINNLGV